MTVRSSGPISNIAASYARSRNGFPPELTSTSICGAVVTMGVLIPPNAGSRLQINGGRPHAQVFVEHGLLATTGIYPGRPRSGAPTCPQGPALHRRGQGAARLQPL